MTKISSVGKFLDQPILTAKINKNMPWILAGGSAAFMTKQCFEPENKDKVQTFMKTGIILGATGISAILAPKIATKITKKKGVKSYNEIVKENSNIISEYTKNSNKDEYSGILEKAKTKILSLKEVDKLNTSEKHKEFLARLVPAPENIQAKDIFKEIGWLSIYGAVPVVGGISGGIVADKITDKGWKSKVPNKIKEGMYQYLANIFMCNIGAGVALSLLEKFNVKSKAARCIGMTVGILLTGVVGGSTIANYIDNKIISPMVSKEKKKSIRTPELLDLSLHTDDIATISLLSGLKWIEPSLPILYSVSGYRAGIGYRNDEKSKAKFKTVV